MISSPILEANKVNRVSTSQEYQKDDARCWAGNVLHSWEKAKKHITTLRHVKARNVNSLVSYVRPGSENLPLL